MSVLCCCALSLAVAIPSAETANAPPAKQIAALKKQVATLKAQVKFLTKQQAALSQQVASLQRDVALIPQLAEIAAATARYRTLSSALADGYVHAGAACIPTAGIHYVKGSWPTDAVLDPLEPEFLMYATVGGAMKLLAVEYAVPMRFPQPTLFGHPFHRYTGGPGEPIWYLHVWLWHLNPAGPLAELNATVEC